ncbi:MAG TPA: drug/metabolite exporter YedA [Candidatus Polarisedimenticolaceae bacterium]
MGDRAFRTKLLLAFAAVYLIWGSTYLAIRYAVETLPPFGMASARFLLAGSILFAAARLRGAGSPTPRMWRDATIVGSLLLLGGNGLVTWAEQRVPSGIAALIVACVPLFMVALQRRVPGVREGAGLAGGLIGIVLLVGRPGSDGAVDLLGAGALVLASLSWAVGSLFSRRAVLPESGLLATGMEMLGGGAALAIVSLLRGEPASFDAARVTASSCLALAYLVTFGAIVGYSAYMWLLSATTPARAATYAYVNPVVAVFLGWAIAGEPLTGRTVAAAAVIVVSVALIVSAPSRGR